MAGSFKIGDRVRLRDGHRHPGYHVGDTGTVTAVIPSPTSGGEALYQVRVNGKKEALYPCFYADELEAE
jgi:hypothetical protein